MEHYAYKVKAAILKSMAHPVRLIIIDALKSDEKCVCDLNKLVDIDQSTLSRHLSVLKNSNIIIDNKIGKKVFYKLRCKCVLNYVECIQNVINCH